MTPPSVTSLEYRQLVIKVVTVVFNGVSGSRLLGVAVELLAVVLWFVLEVFRCNGVNGFGVVFGVGGVQM